MGNDCCSPHDQNLDDLNAFNLKDPSSDPLTGYTGQKQDLARNGTGVQKYTSGYSYTGSWVKNERHGHGTFMDPSGKVLYDGNWIKNVPTTLKDGTYLGEKNAQGQRHGQGCESHAGASTYVGNYVRDKKCGQGRITYADKSVYKGEFANDEINGKGTFCWPGGNTYEGTWKEAEMHGKGLFKWTDGRSYEGDYFNDQKQGKGVFKYVFF